MGLGLTGSLHSDLYFISIVFCNFFGNKLCVKSVLLHDSFCIDCVPFLFTNWVKQFFYLVGKKEWLGQVYAWFKAVTIKINAFNAANVDTYSTVFVQSCRLLLMTMNVKQKVKVTGRYFLSVNIHHTSWLLDHSPCLQVFILNVD